MEQHPPPTATSLSVPILPTPTALQVVGIDLAGPANARDSVMVQFHTHGDTLQLGEVHPGADDQSIWERCCRWATQSPIVVGLDAPLSYNVGGGDRPGDARLRHALASVGLRPGTVMPPTLHRMAYLTLRGLAVARLLQTITPRVPAIVEVHPGAALALRGAPALAVQTFKHQPRRRRELLRWLENQGLKGVARLRAPSDHVVAACAAALAAWQWQLGQAVWHEPAAPPFHPFDYAC
ncbi:MAG: DUF429 domain-containing protein [Gemmataceae bacterium]|nr:DUF429 domain-containing protein [Gemmata sp.]MDW8198250.1 DUF429 domain-containing protein [Gemmataceae bacterium]